MRCLMTESRDNNRSSDDNDDNCVVFLFIHLLPTSGLSFRLPPGHESCTHPYFVSTPTACLQMGIMINTHSRAQRQPTHPGSHLRRAQSFFFFLFTSLPFLTSLSPYLHPSFPSMRYNAGHCLRVSWERSFKKDPLTVISCPVLIDLSRSYSKVT